MGSDFSMRTKINLLTIGHYLYKTFDRIVCGNGILNDVHVSNEIIAKWTGYLSSASLTFDHAPATTHDCLKQIEINKLNGDRHGDELKRAAATGNDAANTNNNQSLNTREPTANELRSNFILKY